MSGEDPAAALSPGRIERVLGALGVQERKPRLRRRASVALVLRYPADEAPRVLLMRRVERQGDPWSGHVSLPGGREEPEDGTARATAERETEEEVGLALGRSAAFLGALPPARPRLFPALQIAPFVYHLQDGVEPEARDEARWTFWLPLDRVLSGALDGTHPYKIGPVTRRFPCWRYEGEVIWGLTHRIMTRFFAELGLTIGKK